jgi:hypothetical protein
MKRIVNKYHGNEMINEDIYYELYALHSVITIITIRRFSQYNYCIIMHKLYLNKMYLHKKEQSNARLKYTIEYSFQALQ